MKRTMLALAAAAAVALTPVLARADLCLHMVSSGEALRFTKWKKLRPGRVAPVQGVYVFGPDSAPFHGSAYMRANGQIQVGILVHTIVGGGSNFTMEWSSGNELLSGTANYDSQGTFEPNGSTLLSSIDCAAIPLP